MKITFFDPNRFIDKKNIILTFDVDNETILDNFCEITGQLPNIVKE